MNGRTSFVPQINQSTRSARRGVGEVSLCFKLSFLKVLRSSTKREWSTYYEMEAWTVIFMWSE